MRDKPKPLERWGALGLEQRVALVCDAVAEQFGCDAAALRKPQPIGLAQPRKLAMFLCHELMETDHTELGRAFNTGRVVALKITYKAHWRRKEDPAFAQLVDTTMSRLVEKVGA